MLSGAYVCLRAELKLHCTFNNPLVKMLIFCILSITVCIYSIKNDHVQYDLRMIQRAYCALMEATTSWRSLKLLNPIFKLLFFIFITFSIIFFVRCTGPRFKSCFLSFVPLLAWLPRYPFRENAIGDLISGISVGIMHLPQGPTQARAKHTCYLRYCRPKQKHKQSCHV